MEGTNAGYINFLAESSSKIHSIGPERPRGARQSMQHGPPFNQGHSISDFQRISPVLLSSIAVPLILLITVINAAAICVTLRTRRLRKLRNMTRTSLAFADLMVGLLVGPMLVAVHLATPNRTFCASYLYLEAFCYTSSLTNMLVVAIERSITILKPLHYNRYLTPSLVWGMIAFAWILSILVAISLPEYRSRCKSCLCVHTSRRKKTIQPIFLVTIFVVFGILMIAMQLKMFLVVKSHRRRISPGHFSHSVGEFTTTAGISATPIAIQLNCIPVAETSIREERNSNTCLKIETLAQRLLQTQNKTREPAVISRYLIKEKANEREDSMDQNSYRGEALSQNLDLYSGHHIVGSESTNDKDRRPPRSQICTIYRSGKGMLGVEFKRDTQPSQSRKLKSISKPTQFTSFMYLAFILIWIPYVTVLLMESSGHINKYCLIATSLTKLLVMFNSLINPFVHTIRKREFRKCVKACFCNESGT